MGVGAADSLLVEPESVESVELVDGEIVARSPWQLFWRRFRSDRVAMVSLAFIVLLILVAIFAPFLVKLFGVTGPNQPNQNALNAFGQPTGPSAAHPFGVDELGRDVLARVMYGARVSLEVAFISTGIAVFLGVAIGTIAGYFRGWIDSLLARLMDIVLAFPILLLAIGLASACSLGQGLSGRPDNPRPRHADRGDRAVILALHRPDHPRVRRSRCAKRSSSRPPARLAPRTPASCAERSCPIWSPRSSSTPR